MEVLLMLASWQFCPHFARPHFSLFISDHRQVQLKQRLKLPIYQQSLHPHLLRHACGFALANKGHDTRAPQAYLAQKFQHTVRYTELAPDRFKDFWR
jgi:site-specific recombinase XerD